MKLDLFNFKLSYITEHTYLKVFPCSKHGIPKGPEMSQSYIYIIMLRGGEMGAFIYYSSK